MKKKKILAICPNCGTDTRTKLSRRKDYTCTRCGLEGYDCCVPVILLFVQSARERNEQHLDVVEKQTTNPTLIVILIALVAYPFFVRFLRLLLFSTWMCFFTRPPMNYTEQDCRSE